MSNPIQIFPMNNLLCDNEEFFKKIVNHYGVVIFALKPETKKRLPCLYIPTQDLTTVHIFPEQVTKVEYGSLDFMKEFIKLTLKYRGGKVGLLIDLEPIEKLSSQEKFLDLMVKNVLPNSMTPKQVQDIPLKSFMSRIVPFFDKFEKEIERAKLIANVVEPRMMILYTNIIFQNSNVERKEMLRFLKNELNNAPQFIKTHYPESNCNFWVDLVKSFITEHRCILQLQDQCSGYSLKKCSRCLVARYCSKQCQKADFKQHSAWCAGFKDRFRPEQFFGESLETILKERIPKIASLEISYSEFNSLVCSKVFDASYNFVADKYFIRRMISAKNSRGETFAPEHIEVFEKADVSKFKMLLKENALPRDVILKQLEDTWGLHPLFNPSEEEVKREREEEEDRERKAMLLRAFMSGLLGVSL